MDCTFLSGQTIPLAAKGVVVRSPGKVTHLIASWPLLYFIMPSDHFTFCSFVCLEFFETLSLLLLNKFSACICFNYRHTMPLEYVLINIIKKVQKPGVIVKDCHRLGRLHATSTNHGEAKGLRDNIIKQHLKGKKLQSPNKGLKHPVSINDAIFCKWNHN